MFEKPPKRTYVSHFSPGDIGQCVTVRMRWFAPATLAPAREGDMRVQFANQGRIFTDVLIRAGPQTSIEVRGVAGGRVRRTIESCVEQPIGVRP
jgi:hypothetical protein